MSNLDNAVAEWQTHLSKQQVIISSDALASFNRATCSNTPDYPVILYPQSLEEVQQCALIANRHRVPLYPISGGKNWGYGSRAAVTEGTVALSLSRMNQIADYDEDLGYVTLQPGVTFRQLHEFLRAQNSALYLNCPGSTDAASVIGHSMERGLVPGPNSNRVQHLCGLQVVLPDGRCIQTGHGAFPNAKTTKIYQEGVGPMWDGLFTQSNLGIVTEMTVWLSPLPDYLQYFTFIIKDQAQLNSCLNQLRYLRQRTILGDCCGLYNADRVLSFVHQFPWEKAHNQPELQGSLLSELNAELGGGIWYGEGAIEAQGAAELAEKKQRIQDALKDCADSIHFDEVNTPNGFNNPDLLTSLNCAYWRKRIPIPDNPNPDRDRCGILWCTTVIPFRDQDFSTSENTITSVIKTFGFEPGISVRFPSSRVLYMLAGIIYDRDADGEDEQAMACYQELSNRLLKHGYPPYRLGTLGMEMLSHTRTENQQFYNAIKNAVDPNHILSPGRYEPGA